MGGNVRVGLEDSLWAGQGRSRTPNRCARCGRSSRAWACRSPRLRMPAASCSLGGERWRSESKEQACASRFWPDVKTRWAKGPLWDVDEQRLYWIDSFDGRVFRCTADGRELRAWDAAEDRLNGVAQAGRAVVPLARGFHFLDFRSGEVGADRRSRARQARQPAERRAASTGRGVSTPAAWTRRKPGPMARSTGWIRTSAASAGHRHRGVERPLLEPGRQDLLFRRYLVGRDWAYDCDPASGAISNRRTFTRVDMSGGGAGRRPTVDAEGYLWNAQVYDGKLVRYAPDGSVGPRHRDAGQESHQRMFGGPELDVLYVTSMVAAAAALSAGRRGARQLVHVARLGAACPEPRFGG